MGLTLSDVSWKTRNQQAGDYFPQYDREPSDVSLEQNNPQTGRSIAICVGGLVTRKLMYMVICSNLVQI